MTARAHVSIRALRVVINGETVVDRKEIARDFVIANPPAIDRGGTVVPMAALRKAAKRKLVAAKQRLTRLEKKREWLAKTSSVASLAGLDRSIGIARRARDEAEKQWRAVEGQHLEPSVRETMEELVGLLSKETEA